MITTNTGPSNLIDRIMAYEQGDLEQDEMVSLFSDLIRSKLVWQLQGSYGRTAVSLIHGGYLAPDGTILAQ